jgi:hypothetical protein
VSAHPTTAAECLAHCKAALTCGEFERAVSQINQLVQDRVADEIRACIALQAAASGNPISAPITAAEVAAAEGAAQ